jgi:hypothetical protein
MRIGGVLSAFHAAANFTRVSLACQGAVDETRAHYRPLPTARSREENRN